MTSALDQILLMETGHMFSSFIIGVEGTKLTNREMSFLSEARPCGLILFARNCVSPSQLTSLVAQFKHTLGSEDVLICIDQEGGRVQRLGPPHWRILPPAQSYGRLWQRDASSAVHMTREASHLMAQELRQLGINTNMVPVLDVLQPITHEIISSRAYGDTPQRVVELGQAVAQGHMAGGVLPVMKHIPGHGRARADSHVELPVVDTRHAELQSLDFAPFARLSDLPAAMTAHVVYSDLDDAHPASTSKIVHERIIRGEMGFDGLLMSDDLSMKALNGSFTERAQAVFAAGSDIALHCNGHMDEMEDVASVAPPLAGRAQERFGAALAVTKHVQAVDICAAEAAIGESLSVTP